MSFNKPKVETPDPILSNTSLEEQTVARLAHLNDLIDQLNDAYNYSVLGFNIVDASGTTPGLIGVGNRGALNAVYGYCSDKTNQIYTYTNGSKGCINYKIKAIYDKYLPVVAKTGVGVYTFTFPTNPPLGYDILLSPPSALNGSRISLVKTTSKIFTITATNASGVAADSLLVGMYLELKIY